LFFAIRISVCDADCFIYYSRFWLKPFKESKVFKIGVFDSLILQSHLLTDGVQVLSIIELLNCSFHSLQPKDQRCDVVKGPTCSRCSNDYLNSICCSLVLVVLATSVWSLWFPFVVLRVWIIIGSFFRFVSLTSFVSFTGSHLIWDRNLFSNPIPNSINAVSVVKSLKDSITTYHNEIKVVLNFKAFDVWITNNYIWVTTITRSLCFDISKGFGNRKSSWENSQWTLDVEIFLSRGCSCFGKGLSPVNLSSSSLDSNLFQLIIRLVISWENSDLCSCINRHHSSWVSHIDNVNHFIDYHDHVRTRSWPLWAHILPSHEVLGSCLCLLNKTEEIPLTLMESFLDGLDWVLRKLFILNHKVMQVISEVVSACRASMSIKHSEKADLRPLNIDVGLVLWLENV